MRYDNKLYEKQGMHAIAAIFTVEKDDFKVLLIRRKDDLYKDYYGLVGGAVYNNEEVEDAINREIKEKTGLEKVNLQFYKLYSDPHRAPVFRMFAAAYIGVVDASKIKLIESKDINARWCKIDTVGELAFDHNKILSGAVEYLRQQIGQTSILKSFFPNSFTLPQLQKIYEKILNKEIDRRNFRKNLINLGFIEDLKINEDVQNKKPAKLYKFKSEIKKTTLF